MDPIDFLELVEAEYGGQRRRIYKNQLDQLGVVRRGQAFMNALRGTPFYDELTGTEHDPFYKLGYDAVTKAIDYLMEKK